jgi:medium-chain acyl-[acyl-carrier-protein] hydrolase
MAVPRAPSFFIHFKPNPGARARLFCFPYAGGGASVYRPWAAALAPSIEVVGVQLPGRESRFTEPAFDRVGPLLDALLPAILQEIERLATPPSARPFAFFGHSLGALVGFELCRRLRAAGARLPLRLFVSGRSAPQLPLEEEPLHALPDADLIAGLVRYNGTPAAVLADAELMELVLPSVRADFAIHETYAYASEPPLNLPITAFGGEDDDTVALSHLDGWRAQTSHGFRRQMFPGDHFYLNDAQAALARAIADDLTPTL